MGQQVLLVEASTIEKMKQFYNDSLQSKLPPGAVFSAKPTNCTVTAYKSGKVLFQGASPEAEAIIWMEFAKGAVHQNKKNKTINNGDEKKRLSQLSLIGSDEVGTGDYFGPMTVVASFVSKEKFQQLTELGVKDSKGMKDPEICKIAKQLIKEIPYSLLVLPNEKYNSLQTKGMNQGKMKAILHNQALLHLKKKLADTPYDGILIDQFVERNIYYRYIAGQKEKVQGENMFFHTKAESLHLSVAASSIIARYAFVKEMDKLSEAAGFEIPKGAGPHVDKAAASLIKKQGVQALNKFCKLHFANTEKAKKLL
ncbi:ribonuclease HIII [Anaerobacillus alkalilacustris]|uniref:Ribonuclease HIII n=1 Tax=Anaerobacillus alkalilacustris TaxID=393763 RepID=A0A1S2LQD5_9BACI|nr:ribonuclease HIII [Anaerobacillus alkalilacustris]OIJ13897.1 ribonuclease HIII [Anaerobacillus alkalilacustris]